MRRGCNVRFEERAREFICVARLTFYEKVTEAKASWKQRESHGQDLKPGDLFMGKVKSPERGMEA